MAIRRERILTANIEDEMKKSYMEYAMSVIISRALPDVRDGLKPVHRRILYAMKDIGLYHNKPFKKAASVVGEVLGKYHPHGDGAIYDSLVRMAQYFSLRYPLVQGQGNFGSIYGDNAAAYRYTEARLNTIAEDMLNDIDKGTVDFIPNFDDSTTEPTVLPSGLPNLLVNGSSGIAVGMATNIPPHNMAEVIDGTIAYIEDPEMDTEGLMKYIKGPDFPTGGIIQGMRGIKKAYGTGKGKITLKARVNFEQMKRDKEAIVITEVPYQINVTNLISKIASLVNRKKITDISDLRDESDKEGMRIVIELKRGANKKVVLNQLFKHTTLKSSFSMHLIALVNNEPKVLTLKEIIRHYINHRREIVRRRTQFDLDKAEARAHIVEGLKIAVANIDEVVRIIKTAEDTNDASMKLQKKFELSELQAQAILDMKLGRLTGLEREKLETEYMQLIKIIEKYRFILSSDKQILEVVKQELAEIKEKYGDTRLTEIIRSEDEDLLIEDLIADEKVIVQISHNGYIKRQSISSYRRQARGGKGVAGMKTRKDDFAERIFIASTHQYILFFTDKGNVYWLKVFKVPEGGRLAKGRAIVNLLEMEKDEHVAGLIPIKKFKDDHYILMVTRQGLAKKTTLTDYSNPRKGGIIAINLREGDNVADIHLTDGNKDVIVVSKEGMSIRFSEKQVRATGRNTSGVKAINLGKDDFVVNTVIVKRETTSLLIATENGYGKRTAMKEFRRQSRGGKGVIGIKTNKRNGKVVNAMEVLDNEELLLIARSGQVIRMPVSDVREIGRNTAGVRLMNLGVNDKLNDIAIIANENEIPEEENNGREDEEE